MSRNFRPMSFAIALLSLLFVAPAYGFNVNKDVKIGDDETTKGQSTVNGSITVGSNAVVSGSLETVNGTIRIDDSVVLRDASTVNGSIRIGDDVQVNDVSTVNGSLRIGERGEISGAVSAVNGKIDLANGSSVDDDVSNVNGEIDIIGSEIGGDLSTVTGDIMLTENSILRGDLLIEKPGGWQWRKSSRKPIVVIGPGSKVMGDIVAEREIELFISDTAEVGGVTGEISLDDAVRFSGNRP